MYEATFYFRAKDQNANIYRINKSARQNNSTQIFEHVGIIIFHNGKIKLNEGETLTPGEEAEITNWLERYRSRRAQIDKLRAYSLIEEINHMAQWLQADATDEDIVEIFEELIMSITDLRQSAMRRYSRIVEDITASR